MTPYGFSGSVIRMDDLASFVGAERADKWRDFACDTSPLNCPTVAHPAQPPRQVNEQQALVNAEQRSGAGHRKEKPESTLQ